MCEGDPEAAMKQISAQNTPPAQCGKLFKMGDPTYSCRDCGHDPTCVLCYACFKNSQHRFCRYKMSTSNGGGYCDCGDSEAWSNHVHCSEHPRGVEGAKGKDPLAQIPVNIQVAISFNLFMSRDTITRLTLQKRARHVFESVLRYAEELLTAESMLTLPPDLTYRDKMEESFESGFANDLPAEDCYCTVVFNDEVI